ncbi:uncharacterized protein LOC111647534 isoform X1 [Seriola lalandi dorsalis]|uniref:uncharacterized protein LOC111647534 isoform X1 n=1 Tax=Seriola lalandi dorsalis TaxID=1841481 RepID=UPI000C6FC39B|nr:uncharacterized protein LOC111647534 isoform X1 [Seriola lalandi dorsalis]
MALSQIQCLDDNHVNPRTHESKPEFLYCEDQRLALEALLQDGREAFLKCLHDRGLRGFLSDPELDTLAKALEPYDPGSELFLGNAEDDEPPLSLHYWPELSDTSIPQMDLGWPDCDAYRGVTRTTVYTQPPMDGQAHIKEIVRKMIAQAHKVIAVVMDVFTDVDIFRDLLDAGFKRRVSVYILLERTTLPHFLSMCQRANMHPGHLKHLRVRCTDGAEFFTRSCTKVKGKLGHRFMFIDGDKTVSGSYSFTWMSSRLDRNLITVVTGQAVDAFDRLFRLLFATSSSVDLRQVATEPEPEPEPLPQPAAVAPPSAAIARKLYNPKYALVAAGNPSLITSAGNNSSKEPQNSVNSKSPEVPETKKTRRRKFSKDSTQEAPPLHPGLTNLEKASLIPYLPTWPEPDPPSDVIGFINIRDANRPTQVHLQRSEMFETSQAIRFSSPFSRPKETLPEVAKPRQLAAKHEEMNKLQPTQDKTKAEESVVDSVQPTQLGTKPDDIKNKGEAPELKLLASGQKSEPEKDTPTDQDAGHNITPHLSAHTPSQSNSKTSTPNTGRPSHPHIPTVNSRTANISTSVPPSCTSSSLTSTPPIPKPRTVKLVMKDDGTSNGQKLPEISVVRRPESLASTGPLVVHSKADLANAAQTPPVKDPETVPQRQNNSGSKRGAQKDSENTENPEEAPQQKQNVTSQEIKHEETVGLHDDRAAVQSATGTKPQAQSDLLITDAAKADSVNIQEIIPKEVEPKSLTSTDCKITSKTETDSVATVQSDTKASEKTLIGSEFASVPSEKSENVIQHKTYHAGAHEPQGMSDCESNPVDLVSETVDSLKASTHTSVSATTNSHTSAHHINSKPNMAKNNTHIIVTSQESQQTPKARASSHTPERPLRLHVYDTHVPDLRSPTPERESRPLAALARTPTPDGFLPRTPTPDTRTHTPDPRSCTPDFRTPTPDVSDGYISSRDDSTLSTTSEEYYECSDTPSHNPTFCNHGTTVDHDSFTHTNTTNATTITTATTSPACINNSTCASMSGTTDRKASSGETQSLSGPSRVSSSSSILEKVKMGEDKEATNEENGREGDDSGKKLSLAERDSEGTETRGCDEAQRTAEHLKQAKESTEVVGKDKEAQAPKRKQVLKQSAAERLINGGESTNNATDAKRLSTGDLKPEKTEKVDKDKVVDKVAPKPSSVERRDRPQSTTQTEGQKSGESSPFRPPRLPQPLSASQPLGARAWASRQPNQAENKVLHNSFQVLDNTSSPLRLPSRPPPPMAAGAVRSATWQKQGEVYHNQQSLFSQLPVAAQSRARFGQSQNQHTIPKPQASFLNSNSHSQNQTVSVREAHRQEAGRAPFTFSFSRLYSLKDLKDKMSKLPGPSMRGGTSFPGQGRKGTG